MTEQPRMPEIPGYPYDSAPGYVPNAVQQEPAQPQVVAPVQDATYTAPAYEVAHNYVVPTVTETYYAAADTYTQPAYEQPVYQQPVAYAPAPVVTPEVAPVQYPASYETAAPLSAPVYVDPAHAAYAPPTYAPPAYEAPVYQAPIAPTPAVVAAPATSGLSRTEQRKREEAARQSAKKSNSIFKAWWLYPLVAAIAVCGYLGWKSAQVPVTNAPSTPIVVTQQP